MTDGPATIDREAPGRNSLYMGLLLTAFISTLLAWMLWATTESYRYVPFAFLFGLIVLMFWLWVSYEARHTA